MEMTGGITLKNNEFQKKLKQALKENGMKQITLAEKTGIPKSTISSYLSGVFIPKKEYLLKMAEVLNVSPSWLLGYDEHFQKVYTMINGTNGDLLIDILQKIGNYSESELKAFYNLLENYDNFINENKK